MRYPSAVAVVKELRFLGLDPPRSTLRAVHAAIVGAHRDALDAFAASLYTRCLDASWAGGHGARIGAFCVSIAYRANDVDVAPDVAAMSPLAAAVRRGAAWWALLSDFRRLAPR